jgi:hypothetical protein
MHHLNTRGHPGNLALNKPQFLCVEELLDHLRHVLGDRVVRGVVVAADHALLVGRGELGAEEEGLAAGHGVAGDEGPAGVVGTRAAYCESTAGLSRAGSRVMETKRTGASLSTFGVRARMLLVMIGQVPVQLVKLES